MAVTFKGQAASTLVAAETTARVSAVAAVQAALDLLSAAAATDSELAAAVAVLTSALSDKQDAASASTDAELAAALETVNTSLAAKQDADSAATDEELSAAVTVINAAASLKQDAATAATDAELAAAVATLTATLSGKQDAGSAATDAELAAAIASVNAAVAAKADDAGAELFLVTFFKDPSGGGGGSAADDDQRLYIGASGDGVEFSQLGGAVSPWGYRDISIVEIGGYYYATGTSVGADPAQRSIKVHRSRSMLPGTWTDVATIDVAGARPSAQRAWAAEFFQDSDGSVYIVASIGDGATDLDFANPFRPYLWKATSSDLTTWAAQGKMTRSGARAGQGNWDDESAIDGTVVKVGATYHMFIKEARTQYLVHHTAPSMAGPWATGELSSAYGWPDSNEAPSLVQLADGRWRLYMDFLTVGQMYYAESTNAGLTAWGPRVKCRVPLNGRHPWVMRSTARRHRDLVFNLALTGGSVNAPMTPFYARAYKDNVSSYTGPGFKKVDWNKKFDPEGAVDLVNDRITAPKTGVFTVEAGVMFSPGPGHTNLYVLQVNHARADGALATFNDSGTQALVKSITADGDQLCLEMSRSIYMYEGDYIEAYANPGTFAAGVGWDLRGDSFGAGKCYLHLKEG